MKLWEYLQSLRHRIEIKKEELSYLKGTPCKLAEEGFFSHILYVIQVNKVGFFFFFTENSSIKIRSLIKPLRYTIPLARIV